MKKSVFILCFLNVFSGYSQDDSLTVRSVMKRKLEINSSRSNLFNQVDTVLTQFYNYKQDGGKLKNSLGNPGLGLESIMIQQNNFGFSTGESVYDFKVNSNERYIYQTNSPFARISYISGPKKYRDFDVFFTENLSENFNFTVKYNTFGSTGTYINQDTKGNSFSFQNSFRTKSDNYGYFLSFKVRSGYAFENGGVKSDSIYNELIKLSPFDVDNNKLKTQVWQEGAVNRFDKRELFLSQFYRFGKQDSTKNIDKGFFIVLNNSGSVDDFWYEDDFTDSLYFDEFGFSIADSSSVSDKSHWFGIRNNGFINYKFHNSDLELLGGMKLNVFRNNNYLRETYLTESSIHIGILGIKIHEVVFDAKYEYGVNGFNSDGYVFNSGFKGLVLKKIFRFNGSFVTSKSLPNYKFLNYAGSTINWLNDFDFEYSNSLTFELNSDTLGIYLSGRAYSIANYVYYGFDVLPQQFSDTFTGLELSLSKNIVLGSFHFDFTILYQTVSNEAPVNLANWIWKGSIYHQKYLFKNSLELRYGLDYWQNSQYTANYYAPFTRSFIYQDKYMVGNFPYINVFFSARIKGAQGFVNFQNVGQIFFRENYMMVPFYPLQDFGMSFGIRWDFYN